MTVRAEAETSWFPETRYAWRRLKLLLAELLVVSTAKGNHSIGFHDSVSDAANSIREFRETYYSEKGQ